MNSALNHFTKFESKELGSKLIESALSYKADPRKDISKGTGKRIGCIFLNPSLRTRVSTQLAAQNLGMEPIVLNMDKEGWALEMKEGAIMNKGTVEHIKDAAGVLGSYFDILAIRAFPTLTNREEDINDFAFGQFVKYSGKPVISLESAIRHPLQSLADQITIQENLKNIKKPKVVLTWAPHIKAIPHAVANSFAEWTLGMGHDLTITHPEGYELDPVFTKGAKIEHDQAKALENADFVYVKNWSSFNDYGKILSTDPKWMLTEKHLRNAPDAKVMHCLPVRRNLELSDEILDGKRSLVQKQAENRIYAAQSVISHILG
ncbi:MAG TPA: acetylornithine carbamoyltransferase [Algoriphagus sp.]|jgi:N-succinyl-L-ornithine transcarbamylase|uniref:acetylornithine carbamoyltransferase n=1 Tax=unclassified Algoriphagus TaxID=2641541 RepID=UPI000C37C673|nr:MULTISPECIES: acetylornithine carbamoyltransferase [unclassified Algoriphagus]MAL12039.1 acetylornithine carbamoyltransferase [Algoriphagus sp.]QYH38546.1 acetylornithine carbamoyltransferase [Algoriphagus sp. NBT04N3]HAZ25965.1 acetylornithine carbamoyltransferase [Algoriphagus sp.]HCD87616.1 acetylornithine carbamoyltransferase [Algoriphagus sp.]HCH43475.1 acetylornithine carbamoyltransferase [Algoriphagus sp.]|tara:strand:+ start:4111 stop:5067 length:957 start_codon:yes stop_codon:yes gene_type:complete